MIKKQKILKLLLLIGKAVIPVKTNCKNVVFIAYDVK